MGVATTYATRTYKASTTPDPTLATSAKESTHDTPSSTLHLKQLTPTEMVVKRERGERYNFIEKYSQEYLKICPMKGIFLLHMGDVVPSDDKEDDPFCDGPPSGN
jgi:hypothetical protein